MCVFHLTVKEPDHPFRYAAKNPRAHPRTDSSGMNGAENKSEARAHSLTEDEIKVIVKFEETARVQSSIGDLLQ